MTERDAATRLADLEDRFLDQAGPKFNNYGQLLEARRRMVWALGWLKQARVTAEDDQKIRLALTHLRQAIALTEKQRGD